MTFSDAELNMWEQHVAAVRAADAKAKVAARLKALALALAKYARRQAALHEAARKAREVRVAARFKALAKYARLQAAIAEAACEAELRKACEAEAAARQEVVHDNPAPGGAEDPQQQSPQPPQEAEHPQQQSPQGERQSEGRWGHRIMYILVFILVFIFALTVLYFILGNRAGINQCFSGSLRLCAQIAGLSSDLVEAVRSSPTWVKTTFSTLWLRVSEFLPKTTLDKSSPPPAPFQNETVQYQCLEKYREPFFAHATACNPEDGACEEACKEWARAEPVGKKVGSETVIETPYYATAADRDKELIDARAKNLKLQKQNLVLQFDNEVLRNASEQAVSAKEMLGQCLSVTQVTHRFKNARYTKEEASKGDVVSEKLVAVTNGSLQHSVAQFTAEAEVLTRWGREARSLFMTRRNYASGFFTASSGFLAASAGKNWRVTKLLKRKVNYMARNLFRMKVQRVDRDLQHLTRLRHAAKAAAALSIGYGAYLSWEHYDNYTHASRENHLNRTKEEVVARTLMNLKFVLEIFGKHVLVHTEETTVHTNPETVGDISPSYFDKQHGWPSGTTAYLWVLYVPVEGSTWLQGFATKVCGGLNLTEAPMSTLIRHLNETGRSSEAARLDESWQKIATLCGPSSALGKAMNLAEGLRNLPWKPSDAEDAMKIFYEEVMQEVLPVALEAKLSHDMRSGCFAGVHKALSGAEVALQATKRAAVKEERSGQYKLSLGIA